MIGYRLLLDDGFTMQTRRNRKNKQLSDMFFVNTHLERGNRQRLVKKNVRSEAISFHFFLLLLFVIFCVL